MGLLNWLKNKSNKESLDTELKQALSLSREGKHIEAYPIFERLYDKQCNATNTFNLFQCAVYCGKTEIENELYEKLKCYSPNPKREPNRTVSLPMAAHRVPTATITTQVLKIKQTANH